MALDALAEHIAAFGTKANGGRLDPNSLVFTIDGGAPVSRPAVGHVWRKGAKLAGLEGVVFHQLRHTAASLLIAKGLSVVAVASYLGHSPAVCLKTYAHLWHSDEERIRAAMDNSVAGCRVHSVSSEGVTSR